MTRTSSRARSAWLGAACAAALCGVDAAHGRSGSAPARAREAWSEVEAEWALRRRAIEPARALDELQAELGAASWRARAHGLDALARLPLELPAALLAALVGCLDDPHPNVRARALAALARSGQGRLDGERALRLARDVLPEVRLELARLAGTGAVEDGEARLQELASDGDPRVAHAARAALVTGGRASDEAVLALFVRLAQRPAEWLALVRLAARTAAGGSWTAELAARCASEPPSPARTSRAAVIAALRFARDEPGDAAALAHGWLVPLTAQPEPALEDQRRGFLLSAAAPADQALGLLLLARLAAFDGGDADRAFLLEGVLAAWTPDALARAALVLEPRAALELWSRIAPPRRAVEADVVAAWLDPARPLALRRAVAEVLDLGFRRSGDPVAGSALAGLLDDPDRGLATLAFLALANAPDARPWLAALARRWSALAPAEQLERLAHLPREHPAAPFRAALLALGEDASVRARSPSVADLLGRFEGDAEVLAALARWLARDQAELCEGGGASGELVLPARGLVLALDQAGDETTRALVDDALADVLASCALASIEVAKVAASSLGRSRSGRERLAAWLSDGVPTRLRLEAALARVSPDADGRYDEHALALLLEHYEGCDGELRRRILERVARLDDPRAVALAERVVSGAAPLEEKALALDTLAARGALPEVVAALGRAAAAGPDLPGLEVRLRAIEAAGTVGGEELTRLLEDLWSRWIAPADAPEIEPEARAQLREELLLALASSGRSWPLVERELLARPIAAAERDLARRLAGRRGSATEFEYRCELRLAEHLARAGRLEPALASCAGWWRIDARLALALAERVERVALDDAGPRAAWHAAALAASERLYALAVTGLEAEAPDDAWPTLTIRARLGWMQAAWRAARWRDALHQARELVRTWRADELGDRAWLPVLGARDAQEGRDPRGWLEASLEQLRAFEALAHGERAAASRHAELAARLAGASAAAREQQARLEDALAGR